MERLNNKLIAPCGINCGACRAHLRKKNKCPGCNDDSCDKPITRTRCKIKNCRERKDGYCFECQNFPCILTKKLDKRYREKYNISVIGNLEFIRDNGINKFVKSERKKWQSPKGLLCMHDKKYY